MRLRRPAQLSEPHLGADWRGHDPVSGPRRGRRVDSRAAASAGRRARLRRLAEHAADADYEQVRELPASLRAALHVLPGNHDDRAALRRHFGLPGVDGEPVQYAADLGPLRLVAIDTTRPGEDPGALDEERLSWLDAELAAAPEMPTVIAMHHPPLTTRCRPWTRTGWPPRTAPSTYMQARLDLRSEQLELVPEPAGFAVHALLDGEVVSHVQPVV